MTALTYASGWDGHTFPRWPIRPPRPCTVCGHSGRPYLAGPRCDDHRPGPPPQTYPVQRPTGIGEYALDRAWAQHRDGRRCAATDRTGRFACPYPLDPANGDEATHMWCSAADRPLLAAHRLAEGRRATAKGAAP